MKCGEKCMPLFVGCVTPGKVTVDSKNGGFQEDQWVITPIYIIYKVITNPLIQSPLILTNPTGHPKNPSGINSEANPKGLTSPIPRVGPMVVVFDMETRKKKPG